MAKGKDKGTGAKPVSIDDFITNTYGDEVVITADVLSDRPRLIIPTTLSLDIALSGGIPEGKVVLISGKPKAGKTTTCLYILRNAIRLNRPAFYVDIERRCDAALLATVRDLHLPKLRFIRSTSEKLLSAQEWLHILERIIKDCPGAVIVVDSLAMLSTLAEQSEKTGENSDMAGVPKLMAAFFRKMKDVIDTNNIVLIFISQYQTNRDPASRKKFDEKGGMGIQYACSVWMNADWFQVWEKDASTKEAYGQDIHYTIRSSALGKPFRPCAIPLRFGEGIDIARDVATHAENLGLIERNGAWYTIPALAAGDAVPKFQGADNLRAFLNTNPEALATLDREVRKIVIPNSVQYADMVAQWTPGQD